MEKIEYDCNEVKFRNLVENVTIEKFRKQILVSMIAESSHHKKESLAKGPKGQNNYFTHWLH